MSADGFDGDSSGASLQGADTDVDVPPAGRIRSPERGMRPTRQLTSPPKSSSSVFSMGAEAQRSDGAGESPVCDPLALPTASTVHDSSVSAVESIVQEYMQSMRQTILQVLQETSFEASLDAPSESSVGSMIHPPPENADSGTSEDTHGSGSVGSVQMVGPALRPAPWQTRVLRKTLLRFGDRRLSSWGQPGPVGDIYALGVDTFSNLLSSITDHVDGMSVLHYDMKRRKELFEYPDRSIPMCRFRYAGAFYSTDYDFSHLASIDALDLANSPIPVSYSNPPRPKFTPGRVGGDDWFGFYTCPDKGFHPDGDVAMRDQCIRPMMKISQNKWMEVYPTDAVAGINDEFMDIPDEWRIYKACTDDRIDYNDNSELKRISPGNYLFVAASDSIPALVASASDQDLSIQPPQLSLKLNNLFIQDFRKTH